MNLNLTGVWTFHGHPWNAPHMGQIAIDLQQEGAALCGTLHQVINPYSGQPPPDARQTEAGVIGEIVDHPESAIVILKRINKHDSFRAVFVGTYDKDQQTITGVFKNTLPSGGTFVMERKFEQSPADDG